MLLSRPKVNIGGRRETHYRSPHIEATLVAFLSLQRGNSAPEEHLSGRPVVPPYLQSFRESVDALLPGYYAWFDEDALHVTIRALAI